MVRFNVKSRNFFQQKEPSENNPDDSEELISKQTKNQYKCFTKPLK